MKLSDKELELTLNSLAYRVYWHNLCEGSS